jgi:hypothetical protein
MALVDLPACPPISVSTCLTGFVPLLDTATTEAIQASIASVETELNKQIGKLASASASATDGLKKLTDQLTFLDDQIANIDLALTAMSDYIATVPCSELIPIQALLTSQKEVLEAQKALFNLSGITDGITTALDQKVGLDGYMDCLNVFKSIF